MKRQGPDKRSIITAALLGIILSVSCGGPYTARNIPVADQKLALAAGLFDRGEYSDAAVEYKDFLADFAGDERGDFAQYMLAECYRMNEEYALAAVEYRILINDYGYSEYIDDAFYLEGLCAFRQSPRPERDQARSYEALGRINRFLQVFPDSPRRAEALATRAEIHDLLGEKDFKNARLYFSRKHFRAALLYFDKIVDNYDETVWAARSRYYRGRIAERGGDAEKAAEEYREAVSSTYEFEEKEDAAERIQRITGESSGEEQG
ncbi:MAG TPA: outer membrane protein assembly factor BamD [Candidatus Krumholzibacterium sp.]|nr:outer membrane protein assembly factor BamD [Candidatus Krumholzibacterium sp.]